MNDSFSLNLKQRRARKHHVAQTEALDCVLPGNLTPAATARASNVIVFFSRKDPPGFYRKRMRTNTNPDRVGDTDFTSSSGKRKVNNL